MIKQTLATILVAGSLILTGCAATDNLFISAVNGAYVVEINGGLIDTIQKVDLTEQEETQLFLAKAKFESLLDEMKAYSKDPLSFVADIHTFESRYNIYKSVYEKDLYGVAENHFDEYSLDEQKALEDAHKGLSEASLVIEDAIKSANYQDSMNALCKYARTIAQIYFLKGV